MQYSLVAIAIIVLALGSFADEAMLVSFALTLADGDPKNLTLLYALSMIGGVIASRSGAVILPKISEKTILPIIFFLQGLVILAFYFFADLALMVLVLSFSLGYLGSLLWTIFLSVLPNYFANNLPLANKIVQTIKNAGFIFAPSLTGFAFGIVGKNLVFILSVISFSCFFLLLLNNKNSQSQQHADELLDNDAVVSYWQFIKTPTMKRVLVFFTITIALTSALNIIMIPYINNQLALSPFIYGTTLSMMSLGLLISPILFSDFFKKIGQVSGAYLAAGLMGIGMMGFGLVSMLANYSMIFMLFLSGLFVGVGNGVQNTLMSEFMLDFCGKHTKQLMPHYVLSLQCCVLLGFGITFMIQSEWIVISLFLFGFVVILCGVLGAWMNHGVDQGKWRM